MKNLIIDVLEAKNRLLSAGLICLAFALSASQRPLQAQTSNPVISESSIKICSKVIRIRVTGGRTPYSYQWKNAARAVVGNNSRQLRNVAPGTYTVTVTDADGKTISATYTLAAPYDLAGKATPHKVKCKGGSDGKVRIFMDGGTDYQWTLFDSRNETVQTGTSTEIQFTITGLKTDNYRIALTDDDDCTGTINFTIAESTVLFKFKESAQVLPKCHGSADGSLTPTFEGGDTPYTYSWAKGGMPLTGKTTQTLSGISAGTYTVTATDKNGCVKSENLLLTQPEPLTSSFKSKEDIKCEGGTSGTFELNLRGGTRPYSFKKPDGTNFPNVSETASGSGVFRFSGLVAGTHTVEIRDAKGCSTANQTVTLTEILPLSVSFTQGLPCKGGANGSLTANVTGGTAPYTYLWSTEATTQTASGLAAGTYKLKVTDANGCVKNSNYTLNEPEVALSVTATPSSPSTFGAADGSIALTVTGGIQGPVGSEYTYSWADDNTATTANRSGLSAGTYEVTVSDESNCSVKESFTLKNPPGITSAKVNNCRGSILLTVEGGTAPFTYAWNKKEAGGRLTPQNQNSRYVTSLAPGTYTVTITDADGKTTTAPAAGYTIADTPLQASITVTDVSSAGNQNGRVRIAMGSSGTASFEWTLFALANNNRLRTGTANSTTFSISALTARDYRLSVRDKDGCNAAQFTFTVGTPAAPTPSGFRIQGFTAVPPKCRGDAIKLTVNVIGGSGNYTYSWQDASKPNKPTISLTDAEFTNGKYNVEVLDDNTNASINKDYVKQPSTASSAFSVSVSSQNDPSCQGGANGSISLSATGGVAPYTYFWLDDPAATTKDRSGLEAGTYVVAVRDRAGCTQRQTITLSPPANPLAVSSTPKQVTCKGGNDGAITLAVSAGNAPYSYSWSNGATDKDISGLAKGSYTVTITDASGCEVSKTYTITEPSAALSVWEITQTPLACANNSNVSLTARVSGGVSPYTYRWVKKSTGGQDEAAGTTTTISGLASGTYKVQVTDKNGCMQEREYKLSLPDKIQIEERARLQTCKGESTGEIALEVAGGAPFTTRYLPTKRYKYLWSTGATTQKVSGLAAGSYMVTLTDASGCEVSKTYTITEADSKLYLGTPAIIQPQCNVSKDGSLVANASGGTPPYTYRWEGKDGALLSEVSAVSEVPVGTYKVRVTDQNGCLATGSYILTAAGTCSQVALSASSISFGETLTGKTASKTITISNPGDGKLKVTDIECPVGFKADWRSGIIAAGGKQKVNISFSPTEVKGYGGTVEVISDAITGSKTFTVSGKGTQAASISLSANSLSFEDMEVGTTASKAITIANTGNIDLNISNIEYPEGFKGDWSAAAIAVESSKELNITFSPILAKDYANTIKITSALGTHELKVFGKGQLVTAVEPNHSSLEFKVFPNPAEDVLHIKLTNQSRPVTLQLIDVNGQVVYEKNAVTTNELSIDVSGYKSGVYVLLLSSGKVEKRKVVIR